MLAAHHGSDAELVVRLPSIDPALVKRLMDAGVRSYRFEDVSEAFREVEAKKTEIVKGVITL